MQDLESVVTSILPIATSQAGELLNGVESLAQGVGDAFQDAATKIADVVPAIATHAVQGAKDVIGDIGDGIEGLVKDIFGRSDIHLPFLAHRSTTAIEDTLSRISDITACISNTLEFNANPVFQVAKCAAELAGVVVPVGKLRAVKRLVGALGGDVRTVQRLGGVDLNDGDEGGDGVDGLGKQVLDLLGELSGIGDVVDACKFVVEE